MNQSPAHYYHDFLSIKSLLCYYWCVTQSPDIYNNLSCILTFCSDIISYLQNVIHNASLSLPWWLQIRFGFGDMHWRLLFIIAVAALLALIALCAGICHCLKYLAEKCHPGGQQQKSGPRLANNRVHDSSSVSQAQNATETSECSNPVSVITVPADGAVYN